MESESISELVDIANKVCMKFSQKLKQGGVTKRMMEALHQMKKSLDQMNQLSAQQDWQSGTDMKEVDNLIMIEKIESHLDQKQKNEANFCHKQVQIKKEQQQEQQSIVNQQNLPLSFSPTQRMARGPYRQYSEQIKENVIELYKQGVKFSKISRIFNIPTKNVIRWCRNGPYRKPGAGRKVLDPVMQEQLYFWIQRNYEIGSQIQVQAIRRKAKQFGKIQGFYASMGWLKNFDKRYGLKKRYKLC